MTIAHFFSRSYLFFGFIFIALTGCGSSADDPNKGYDPHANIAFALVTTNGGLTWSKSADLSQHTVLALSYGPPYIAVTSDKEGLAIANSATANISGWHNSGGFSLGKHYFAISATDNPQHPAIVVGEDKSIGILNAGNSIIPLGYNDPGTDLFRINMSLYPKGYIASEAGILFSADSGNTWNDIYSGSTINDVDYAAGGQIIIGTKARGEIVRSSDFGVTWQTIVLDLNHNNMGIINFQDDGQTVNCFSSTGMIFHSTDAGQTWQNVSIPGFIGAINDIDQSNAGLIAIGANSVILRSTDQGAHWTQSTGPVAGTYEGIAFEDDLTGVIVGNY